MPVCGGGGLFVLSNGQTLDMPGAPQTILWMVILFWLFLGVSIIADVFMCAIEMITSKEKVTKMQVADPETGNKVEKEFHTKVWNGTVANLTLMALGSSAPEILLSVIEVVANDFFTGDLGPSTIVGSAAFNLLCIIAICVVAIPTGEVRTIADMGVFKTTAVFSVFAYLWLVVVLKMSSPDIVDTGEAFLTLLFFPLLVIIAYSADANKLCFKPSAAAQEQKVIAVTGADGREMSKQEVAHKMQDIRRKYGAHLSDEQVLKLLTFEQAKSAPKSRAYYRVQATRNAVGGHQVKQPKEPEIQSTGDEETGTQMTGHFALSTVQFDLPQAAVAEDDKVLHLDVIREGHLNTECAVDYTTEDGVGKAAAKAGEDYVAKTGSLQFTAGQEKASIEVEILNDSKWEGDETFTIKLMNPSNAKLGEHYVCTTTIVDTDNPGVFAFVDERPSVKESDGKIVLTVVRKRGQSGKVSCKYSTKDGTACAGADYVAVEGTLVFEDQEASKDIEIEIMNDADYEKEEHFQVIISDAEGGATFDETTDGEAERCISKVAIISDDDMKGLVDRIHGQLNFNAHAVKLGSDSYAAQFKEALSLNGGEPVEGNVVMAWFSHLIALPWKFIFAFCPPTSFCGGWLCFCVALGMIGLVTCFIGDVAGLMGCAMGMQDSITAITFVALGTSLPDAFASKAAATGDPYADAAIGNVTGSNSVNVFLGLGLPWVIAAIFWNSQPGAGMAGSELTSFPAGSYAQKWHAKYIATGILSESTKMGFAVPAGSLGFSVIVFSCCAVICLLTIVLRRILFKAELGGPPGPKYASGVFFVLLWFLYVGLVWLQTDGVIEGF